MSYSTRAQGLGAAGFWAKPEFVGVNVSDKAGVTQKWDGKGPTPPGMTSGYRIFWPATRAYLTGSSKDGTVRYGSQKCEGDVFSETNNACPPVTYSNATWKKLLGITHQYWNERRVREAVLPLVDPAFGFASRYEAAAAAANDSIGKSFGRDLKVASENFKAMFPMSDPSVRGSVVGADGVRWKTAEGAVAASTFFPDLRSTVYNANAANRAPAFSFWAQSGTDFRKLGGQVQREYEAAKKRLGLTTPAKEAAWVDEAIRVINSVPGSEPSEKVRTVKQVADINDGRPRPSAWLAEFVDVFGRGKVSPKLQKK